MKKRVMNLVNFVRGCEPRSPDMDLLTPIKEEIAINKQYGFDHTVLLQYDALIRPDMIDLIKQEADEQMELGLWFEMCRDMTEAVGFKLGCQFRADRTDRNTANVIEKIQLRYLLVTHKLRPEPPATSPTVRWERPA